MCQCEPPPPFAGTCDVCRGLVLSADERKRVTLLEHVEGELARVQAQGQQDRAMHCKHEHEMQGYGLRCRLCGEWV